MSEGSYDRALLANGEDSRVTNGRNKQFYDADILKEYDEQERQRQTAPASRSQTDLEGGRQKEAAAFEPLPSPAKRPWYKTRKGLIAIVIIILVIIGAVVGGAVGGTRKSSNKSSNNNGGGQSQAPVGTGSAGTSASAGVASNGAQVGGASGATSTSPQANVALPTEGVASSPQAAGISG